MKKNPARNAFYAQSGGVSAVINASACGVIETALRSSRIGQVYAGRDGIIGALTEDLIDVGRESRATIRALKHTPAGAFGSARFKLKGIDENRAEYERLIEVFRAHNIGYFFYNGGNDSMDTALKVSQLGAAHHSLPRGALRAAAISRARARRGRKPRLLRHRGLRGGGLRRRQIPRRCRHA